jgi:preprotein translocase subunit SecA
VAAYEQKAAAVDDIEPGLMQEAQKFFVLTQTDNLWKEHLQVRPGLGDCLAYEQAGGQSSRSNAGCLVHSCCQGLK